MGLKIVLTAATIAFGFLGLGEQSFVQTVLLLKRPRCRPLPKRNQLRCTGGSRTRSHAPSSDAIPFQPVATRK